MKALLTPAVRLMGRLRFGAKFAVVTALFALPIAFLAGLLVSEMNSVIAFAEKERVGVKYDRAVLSFLQHVQQHRGLAGGLLNGDKSFAPRIEAKQAEIAQDVAAIAALEKAHGAELGTASKWAPVLKEWETLRGALAGMNGAKSYEAHTALSRSILDYVSFVADASNLTLDPDIDSYYLMDSFIVRLPEASEATGQARAFGMGVVTRKVMTPEEKSKLVLLTTLSENAYKAGMTNLEKAFRENAGLKTKLADAPKQVEATGRFIATARAKVIDAPEIAITPQDYFAVSTAAIDESFKANAAVAAELDVLLAKRIATKSAHKWQLLGLTSLVLLIAAYLLVGFYRNVNDSLSQAVRVAQAVAKGDLDTTVVVEHRDEVAKLLEAMQGMVATLNAFSAAQKDVAAKHDAGQTAAKMDATQFEGAYREMAEGVNELAAGHIRVMGDTICIVSEYAQGNLAHDMAELPGERAKITAAMKTVKGNLTAINGEILKLTSAASRGDFTARGDAQRFDHDFRKMIEGLNGLMQVADRGLSDVAKTLGRIARGDLSARIHADYEGTFGQLKDSSNETASQLGQIVAQIRESAESIATASGEIAQGNADLSQRTEEQAANLEETASSMEELTSTVKQNAENAKQANQLAVSASGAATKGGQVVSQVVETMGAITESAKKIADIIGTIDGIAFQTNILALNAAVEAARAGEQGRGFAVVAGEVRNLAQRSAEAAKEIKTLIGDSVEKVESGSKLVNDAGQTMDEVVKSVKRVADIISEITAASQEQSAGIEQVNQAITQMDQVTQQNAALVEQAAAAAESMREQAQGLSQAVSVFQLDSGKGPKLLRAA